MYVLRERTTGYQLSVHDNGKGFSVDREGRVQETDGRMGMTGMRERMHAVGGHVDFGNGVRGAMVTMHIQVQPCNGDGVMTDIRVLIADDHALVREGIRHVLDAEPGIDVVAEAGNGREAVELALLHRPDVVVLDITMPEETGLKAAERLRDVLPSARVLLLSMHDQSEYVREGMRVGVSGYILKDSAGEELRKAIRTVLAGGNFFSPAVVKRLTATASPT